ncbi:ABC transporter ATP-binding protein [Gorillibacterium sp. sgz5001074]|uniref:ABC transporter ATP-binding protein n=1 Tax=Gorillibacterium sp. sgz5001074 TaxID=3446695 RepID=UPI003F66E0AA
MTDNASNPGEGSLLELVQVSKTIRGKTIVHPFDFGLPKGSVLALCGGNGAGKSTILRMVAGITQPTTGTIRLGGRTWSQDRRGYASSLGYMPDDFQFGHSLTAGETLDFYAALRGPEAIRRVDAVLEEVGLFSVKRAKVSSFSKGMRQRLLFGQALLGEPELLVLDEPTNGLDPYWLQAFVELIRARKAKGQSVIFSTHHLEAAELAADYAILLHEGRIRQAGAMEEFRADFGEGGLQRAFTYYLSQPAGSGRQDHTDREGLG